VRKPSAETQLRLTRRELKASMVDRLNLTNEVSGYRRRATKAEQECAEWKARFDLLLSRTPVVEEEK
jgi:hypothetical protein